LGVAAPPTARSPLRRVGSMPDRSHIAARAPWTGTEPITGCDPSPWGDQ
jgi:hypothetical protein